MFLTCAVVEKKSNELREYLKILEITPINNKFVFVTFHFFFLINRRNYGHLVFNLSRYPESDFNYFDLKNNHSYQKKIKDGSLFIHQIYVTCERLIFCSVCRPIYLYGTNVETESTEKSACINYFENILKSPILFGQTKASGFLSNCNVLLSVELE